MGMKDVSQDLNCEDQYDGRRELGLRAFPPSVPASKDFLVASFFAHPTFGSFGGTFSRIQ
jgi:hypothetical protein